MFFRGFSALPELRSERLSLRRVTLRDAKDVYEVSSDPRVARYVMWHTHRSLAESRDFVRDIQRNYRADRPSPWGIELVEENKLIGTIGFAYVNRDHQSAEIGYSLGYAYWNRGLATEALGCVIDYAFGQMGLNRVEAQHDIRNPASGRVMEKAGMRLEGRLRERLYSKGEYITVDLYSVLRHDWRALSTGGGPRL